MGIIRVNISKEKDLEHRYGNLSSNRLRTIKKSGTPMQRKVANRILGWEEAGRKSRLRL